MGYWRLFHMLRKRGMGRGNEWNTDLLRHFVSLTAKRVQRKWRENPNQGKNLALELMPHLDP